MSLEAIKQEILNNREFINDAKKKGQTCYNYLHENSQLETKEIKSQLEYWEYGFEHAPNHWAIFESNFLNKFKSKQDVNDVYTLNSTPNTQHQSQAGTLAYNTLESVKVIIEFYNKIVFGKENTKYNFKFC